MRKHIMYDIPFWEFRYVKHGFVCHLGQKHVKFIA